jgi:mannose-6-phosphate isomerase class I
LKGNFDIFIRPQPIGLYKVWGGTRLASSKQLAPHDDEGLALGEVIEVSDLEDIKTLDLDRELQYLFKLIDTEKPLSVQVHPGNEYARRLENSTGKSECWYILAAENDSQIFLGLKPGVDRKEIEQLLKNNGDLSKLMRSYSPKTGDFFTVPSGTIHAIGAGITLAEVQQPSGVTYRFWDWGRVNSNGESRELHVQKAFDVMEVEDSAKFLPSTQLKNDVLWEGPGFIVKRCIIKTEPSKRDVQLKANSTLFACDRMIYQFNGIDKTLESMESVFVKENVNLCLRTDQNKEVQCLVIEPQN